MSKSADLEVAETKRIWRALVVDYRAVKENFEPRETAILNEINSWQAKLTDLRERYGKADEMIAHYESKIARLEKEQRDATNVIRAKPGRRKMSKLDQLRELQRKAEQLKRELGVS